MTEPVNLTDPNSHSTGREGNPLYGFALLVLVAIFRYKTEDAKLILSETLKVRPAALPIALVAGVVMFWHFGDSTADPIVTLDRNLKPRCVAFVRPDAANTAPTNTAHVLAGVDASLQHLSSDTAVFRPVVHNGDSELLERRMRSLYYADGCRIFVVTNGSTVRALKPAFGRLRSELLAAGNTELPVLITTVISEDRVADSAQGIYRYFVRVTDEAEAIAASLANSKTRVDILYVEPIEIEDYYGLQTATEIQRALRNLDSAVQVQTFPVDINGTRAHEVARRLGASISQRDVGLVAIGFGPMFSRTIQALAEAGARSLVGSVLATEPNVNRHFPETVDVYAPYPMSRSGADLQSVLRAFPLRAVKKAFACAGKPFNASQFDTCWKETGPADREIGVTMLPDGDVTVSLVIRPVQSSELP